MFSLFIQIAVLPKMIKRKEGRIVCVSSIQGKFSLPHRSAYSASKHALQAFCDSLRAEVAEHNISVLCVSPGYINTALSLNALTASGRAYGSKYFIKSKFCSFNSPPPLISFIFIFCKTSNGFSNSHWSKSRANSRPNSPSNFKWRKRYSSSTISTNRSSMASISMPAIVFLGDGKTRTPDEYGQIDLFVFYFANILYNFIAIFFRKKIMGILTICNCFKQI